MVCVLYERDSLNYVEAMRSTKCAKWQTAMQEEIAALKINDVWRFTKRSPRVNTLHSKWAFKTKTGADGELERYNTRLVACSNEKVRSIDYNLVFATVMNISTAKVVLVLAAACRPSTETFQTPTCVLRRKNTSTSTCKYHAV